MNVNVLIFVFVYISSIYSNNDFYTGKVKIVTQSRFEPPIDTHLIEALINIRSLILCSAICERHLICRTADYSSTTDVCRLFETLAGVGTILSDPTSTVVTLNYCPNDHQTEPEYICSRSGSYTVQQMFDQLALSSSLTLSSSDRGAYANMHGVYTSSLAGDITFFDYSGVKTTLVQLLSETTNINSATRNGLGVVEYYTSSATIYKNVGTPFEPQFVSTLNISLPATPYSCLVTSEYIYIGYSDNNTLMTIHNLSTGSILFVVTTNYSLTYRPVIAQWNDTIIVLDQYQVLEYTLTGLYKGTWPYFSGRQLGRRHYVHHDYAGRRYTCNSAGTNPGIYAFLLNGTELARGPTSCYRAFQVYITKEQAILINIPGSATMKVINF